MNKRQVRVSERSVAELQHGMRGTVIDGPNDHGDLLVRLEPEACGDYCGDYWFPADDLDDDDTVAGAPQAGGEDEG
jgi:hypothetical protein